MRKAAKLLWPDSLVGQLLILFCLGVAALQAGNMLILRSIQNTFDNLTYFDRGRNAFSFYMAVSQRQGEERMEAVRRYNQSPEHDMWNINLALIPPPEGWPEPDKEPLAKLTLTRLREMLAERTDFPDPKTHLRIIRDRAEAEAAGKRIMAFVAQLPLFPVLEIAMELDDHQWLSVLQPLGFDDARIIWIRKAQIFFLGLSVAAFLFILVVRVTRPLKRFTRAAQVFADHPDSLPALAPIPETGALEVREASRSFNLMRRRLMEYVVARDRMLSAMSHDMRTPLTRLQLRLEDVEPEDLRDKILRNCHEIGSIVQQGIELIRSPHAYEEPEILELNDFLGGLAEDARALNREVDWQGISKASGGPAGPVNLTARPLCLKRCLTNLLENALLYGGENVILSAKVSATTVTIDVMDSGPGIPAEELDKVFEPYYRLEHSRNRASGGTGLGLSIAKNMALLNGADLTLSNRPEGGLRARLKFSSDWPKKNFCKHNPDKGKDYT